MQLTSLQTLNPRCNTTSVATALNTVTYLKNPPTILYQEIKKSGKGNLYLQKLLVQSKSNLMNQV
jgi:hypothetical protein